VSEGSPPQRPPQVSPDGKWVWDGTEWQPVAGRDSGHTAVFPAFNPAALQASMVDPTPAAPTPFGAAPPVVNYAANYSAPQQTSAPLWQVKPGHWNKYLYVVAGIVVLVMAGIFLNSLGPISLPFGGGSQQASQTPAPSLLSKRSDFAVADRFVAGDLATAMNALSKTVVAQALACNGVLTIGCQAALVETDNQLKSSQTVIAAAQVPSCVAPSVAKLAGDLGVIQVYMNNALRSFSDNSKSELAAALAGFNRSYRILQSDFAGAIKAKTTYCDTQLTGP